MKDPSRSVNEDVDHPSRFAACVEIAGFDLKHVSPLPRSLSLSVARRGGRTDSHIFIAAVAGTADRPSVLARSAAAAAAVAFSPSLPRVVPVLAIRGIIASISPLPGLPPPWGAMHK